MTNKEAAIILSSFMKNNLILARCNGKDAWRFRLSIALSKTIDILQNTPDKE
jgi:hypothetical protein